MSTAWGVALLVGAGLCALVVAVVHSLIADEIRDWLPYLARRLVRSTARRLPAGTRDRYESDWLAELAAWEGRPLAAFAKAAHIRWKARAIRQSLGGASVGGERVKRAFDLVSALALLLALAPLLIATAIAIKLESPGPVIFRSSRVGRGNKSFRLIKFRYMYVHGEHHRVTLSELREGPRLTRVGRFIRRYSLDELPQLFNVLMGDMSMVGPRPRISAEIDVLDEDSKLRDLEVRPGLTGPGRIHKLDSGAAVPRESKLDEEYVQTRSLRLDVRLLLRTVSKMLRGR